MTTFGLANSAALSMACAAVPITQSLRSREQRGAGVDQRRLDQRLVALHVDHQRVAVQAEQRAGLGQAVAAGGVVGARQQRGRRRGARRPATISASSAATTTRDAPDSAARRATRTTIGSPPMSASGLRGSRRRRQPRRHQHREAQARASGAARPARRRARAPRSRASPRCRRGSETPGGRHGRPVRGGRALVARAAPCTAGRPAVRAVGGPWSVLLGARAGAGSSRHSAASEAGSSRKSSVATQTRVAPSARAGGELDRVLLGQDHVGRVSPARAGRRRRWWSGSAQLVDLQAVLAQHREEAPGRAMPAAASSGRPAQRGQRGRGSAPRRAHQRRATPRRRGRAAPRPPGQAVLGGGARCRRTTLRGGASRGSGSRSGPAGSSQPLPAPRSSNTISCASRAEAQVLQAVVG